MVVLATSDIESGIYYLLDRPNKRLVKLGSVFQAFHAKSFCPSRPIQLKSRDGLTLHGRLVLPDSSTGKPPLVVITVGETTAGSRSRNRLYFFDQVLATRGYATLRLDYRGTYGYGRAFLQAGDYQIDKGMPNDLEDGIHWLVQEGLIDESRVAFCGVATGGLVAMQALARSPLWAAWVNFGTPTGGDEISYTDLAMFPHERREVIDELGGKHAAKQYLESLKAEHLVNRINVPSFHVYDRAGNSTMESLLRESKAPSTFIIDSYHADPDEAKAAQIKILERMLVFLDENLMHHRPAGR